MAVMPSTLPCVTGVFKQSPSVGKTVSTPVTVAPLRVEPRSTFTGDNALASNEPLTRRLPPSVVWSEASNLASPELARQLFPPWRSATGPVP